METMLKPSLVVDHLLQTIRAVIHQANPSSLYVGPPSSSNADPRNQGGVAASPSGSAAVQQPSQPPRANLHEITARCSLGNLFQIMSDCASALDQYEIVLELQGKIGEDGAALGWAEGNNGNALLGLNRLKEAISHLQSAFDLARKHEKMNQGIARAASNLGNAFQAAKNYDKDQNSFEIAIAREPFCVFRG